MNIGAIIAATVLVAAVGLFIGIFLGVAGNKFAVEVDEKEVAVREALPGNNCGGCGFAGCSGLAAAIAKGEAAVNTCPVGGEEVGKKIAAICAAPSVFSGLGFLKDKKATSYPSFMEVIAKDGAQTSEDSVVVDGNITTSRGLGTAIDFALSIIEQLESKEKADEIAESIVYKR